MLQERPLHPEVRDLLISNEPFSYAHLVKFERPSRPDSNSGQVSTSAERYTYICDASQDVPYDDGSKDHTGTSNGIQIYRANKVLQVSPVSEDTEAKASSFSLVLDGNGLGAYVKSDAFTTVLNSRTIDLTVSPTYDLIRLGFREGDKVEITGAAVGTFNIQNFRGPNIVRLTSVDAISTFSQRETTISLSSEEIVSILLDKNDADYASFINREVFIYRIYAQNGTVVGEPFLLYKGIISGVSFDDGDTALTVTWSLSSHWGDFNQVKGRITSDDFHRALDQNGVPQPQSALKIAYAYDKGFSHAETSINILAQYSVQVEKQDVTFKKGFLGIGGKVKIKKYTVNESRNTSLDFQLLAKSIPVIYGVRNTEGIPIFADTLNNDSSTVYLGEAVSEGEIGGIYDVYVDGNSLICNDKADFDSRSTQTSTETVKLICRGRADRGDVLGGITSESTVVKNDFYNTFSYNPLKQYKISLGYDFPYLEYFPEYIEPTTVIVEPTGAGIFDGQSISLTSPQQITFDVFSGKPGQKASAALVSIAKANNFKIQNDYWSNEGTGDYWSPNHRLLDTAYIVGKYKIEEGETSIPSTEYIVRGKLVDCYNYDYSYSHDNFVTGENKNNFALGAFVNLTKMDGTILNANVQIIDKWTFANADGTLNTRFRFSQAPNLGYLNGVPSTTRFRMVSGSNTWTMITYNHKTLEGFVSQEWIAPVTNAYNSGGFVGFSFSGNSGYTVGGDPLENSSAFSIVNAQGMPVSNLYFGYAVLIGAVTQSSLLTKYSWSAAGNAATATVGQNIVRRNVITLPASASTTNGYYNGHIVTLTRIDNSTGRITTQSKRVIDYVGSSRLATIDDLWDYGYHPKPGDYVYLTPAYADKRVSINTPLQLMDYITSPTYGRDLDPHEDLNFASWLESARICDTQSNVTLKLSQPATLAPGTKWRYPADTVQALIWQGTVVGSESDHVEFTDVIGKFSNKWNNWKSYQVNELVYNNATLYLVTAAGVKAEPTHGSGTVNGLQAITALTISNGGQTASIVTDGNPVRSVRNGITVPGYSLYDCDGVDYWRMLGWDEFSQRYVTRHQTNLIVDTSLPLLDNINSFLEHFGGILRYAAGQYFLEVEDSEGPIAQDDPRTITADEIIGKIRLNDEGIRNSYNSLTASYPDPANKFESRNISFFNSDYLKADRNVPKKGSVTVPGITNYYNTRILADKFLNKSRFGLTASFNMRQSGAILLSGKVIQIQYPRYKWDNKKFRILSLTHQQDATVDIVAQEYDDSFYGLSRISKQAASGLAGGTGTMTTIDAPTNLRATSAEEGDETNSAVVVTWDNNPLANTKSVSTELYSSYSSHLYVQIASISSNTITTVQNPHQMVEGELVTSISGIAGLDAGKSYFIKATPSANTLQLSDTKAGPLLSLTDNASVGTQLQTANLTATVPIPGNSYVDVFGGIDNRVVKYYWVRHKIVQGN